MNNFRSNYFPTPPYAFFPCSFYHSPWLCINFPTIFTAHLKANNATAWRYWKASSDCGSDVGTLRPEASFISLAQLSSKSWQKKAGKIVFWWRQERATLTPPGKGTQRAPSGVLLSQDADKTTARPTKTAKVFPPVSLSLSFRCLVCMQHER